MQSISKSILTLFFLLTTSVLMAQSYQLKSDANLRSAPGTDATVVVVIKEGQQVNVIEKTNDNWYKVEVDGKKGYISSSVLKNTSAKNKAENDNDRKNKKSNASAKQTSSSTLPTLAVGFRLGTPTAISIKKYKGTTGIEFVIGTMPNFYNKYDYNYYNNKFNNYYFKNKNYKYNSIDNRGSFLLGLNLSKQKESTKIAGLYIYGAGGINALFNKYTLAYHNTNWGYVEETDWFVDLGLNALIGVEYHFQDMPFSAFFDMGGYFEFYHELGNINPQASIGARYHLN